MASDLSNLEHIVGKVGKALQQTGPASGGRPDIEDRIIPFLKALKIIDKAGRLIIFNKLHAAQEMVLERIMDCRQRRVPARFICLKSRQLGISTLIEAFIFTLITLQANRFGYVVA